MMECTACEGKGVVQPSEWLDPNEGWLCVRCNGTGLVADAPETEGNEERI